jgi:hypothetical protein
MRAINHALTGASIAIVVDKPMLAIPLAFLSHFACDALPHFDDTERNKGKAYFNTVLSIDATLCALLVLGLYFLMPTAWLVPAAAAFAATSPDFMWIKHWLKGTDKPKINNSWITRFHSWIQWSQTKPGMVVEFAWFFTFCLFIFAKQQ